MRLVMRMVGTVVMNVCRCVMGGRRQRHVILVCVSMLDFLVVLERRHRSNAVRTQLAQR